MPAMEALEEDELLLTPTLELLPAPIAAPLAAELPPPHPASVMVSVMNAMIANAELSLVLRPMSLPLCELCLIFTLLRATFNYARSHPPRDNGTRRSYYRANAANVQEGTVQSH